MLENAFWITIRRILEKRIREAPVKGGFAIYLFGSALKGKHASDVDLLIVYDQAMHLATASQIRVWLAEVIACDFERKADICLLSSAEEAEVRFIEKEEASLLLNAFD
jgi:predicted nucleotidyltransferase